MNMSKWIDDMINAPIKKPLPILSYPGVQLLGMTVRQMIENSRNQAECMKVIAKKFDCAASVGLMDLSVEAQAFGSTVKFSDNEVPTVTGSIVRTADDAENLKVPVVGEGRTGVCIHAVEAARMMIDDRPVFAGVIGPFSLSGRLMDMTEIMIKCLMEPELTHTVLTKAADFIMKYSLAMKAAGADGLIIAEPAAGLLSPGLCEEFSSCYVKKIVDAVQDDNFIVIYHNCGNTLPLVDSIIGIGAKAYHFGNAVDIGTILDKVPDDIPILGNLSPAEQFLAGTQDSITAATIEMLSKADGHRNYIPSSGCDIPPLTPINNIKAFFAAVEEYYNKRKPEE